MASSGYSHRSLADKLGIKSGMVIAFFHQPDLYIENLNLPKNVSIQKNFRVDCDMVQCFVQDCEECNRLFPKLAKAIKTNGVVWISWPKGSSRILTDINENKIREIGLKNGMVDVKVIAVDDNWSGLKFVYRLVDR